MPWRPCSTSATIHHDDTAAEHSPARAIGAQHARTPHSATTHTTAPVTAKMIAVAFTVPAIRTAIANRAGSRHPPRITARRRARIIHGNTAHGSRIAEIRDTYWNRYGDRP